MIIVQNHDRGNRGNSKFQFLPFLGSCSSINFWVDISRIGNAAVKMLILFEDVVVNHTQVHLEVTEGRVVVREGVQQ